MEVNILDRGKKRNFDFVDTIRCISMMGIVFEHSTILTWHNYNTLYDTYLQAAVMQSLKFVTIAFFLIAGFLINHKFTEYTPLQYIKNRFKKTIGPWAFWLHVLIVADIFNLWFKFHLHHYPVLFNGGFINYISTEYYNIIFTTSFWFILNFLICISILLLFKRFIYSLLFGTILGMVSFFYSVNLYYSWIQTSHTTALFGFVFYLWLGAYMNKNYAGVSAFIKRTPITYFVLVTIVCFALGCMEIVHLQHLASLDAYNTLRISNIIYSLVCFALLLKIGSIRIVNDKFDPRNTTYGIYLIHQIIITHIIVEIFRPFHLDVPSMSIYAAIGYSLARFAITYGLSIMVIKFILLTRFRWSIGS